MLMDIFAYLFVCGGPDLGFLMSPNIGFGTKLFQQIMLTEFEDHLIFIWERGVEFSSSWIFFLEKFGPGTNVFSSPEPKAHNVSL